MGPVWILTYDFRLSPRQEQLGLWSEGTSFFLSSFLPPFFPPSSLSADVMLIVRMASICKAYSTFSMGVHSIKVV